ncbi:class II D-tagatose-bisphosphate aldolase, non-catalytic subunit [Clostridium chauvoei]|uniref:Class II D-tagatose-bisphosphate aldolase, non-catalytic subunit n=3 Tax=Clostridium chauvoei TaxID=46867 RepID=A0ABD4RIA3_9CLOT|nr:class II D-tagatose-bisphosphate aldolase, non-catalytic subunit [Clostridium chauvoei]ATD55999.1 tagatose-bisphosphate aldolase [Clostridium chauvoei]ATD56332.1 tagatose-bisphosphate aldolase [Clostridium chauvoei]MBX7280898.1 class II D-tagatose-bisphosphate aldolase, non-catalytic subunit [Clostridium chauvoei]MBX7283381.1 class II D-tagatose-bisphosphate aldolase, non-catalytic subunit [Clostridium chauvoei]MBX7285936.1 class II D-tagatose-bisphosphate aldolase, non-catalytic subunit [C
MVHPIKEIVTRYKNGENVGIFSVCSSNKYVIEAAMERLKDKDMCLLVESTANQVDQFGGYTGMKPKDFVKYIHELAEKNNFPIERIILGGDHLGPLTWTKIAPIEAMENAKDLIREYVLAGFTKIHIDTSMPLKGDIEKGIFGDSLIANRASILCKVAEESYLELLEQEENAIHPVYVIGSEVPIPGGAQGEEEEEEGIVVTKVSNFRNTINTFKEAFESFGVGLAWDYVVGVVVQPGVEFGSDHVWGYNREAAKELTEAISEYPELVFEAHSTDYQTPKALKEMVEDGYIILKVGPALTFGFREGVFALNAIENELFKYNSDKELSKFMEILEFSMIKEPKDWKNHYSGTSEKIKLDRKYSLSDRCRYYMPKENVNFALEKLLDNLNGVEIPITLVSQFMHNQYKKIRDGELELTAESLLKDRIGEYIDDYIFATEEAKVLQTI